MLGNSNYCMERFMQELQDDSKAYSIEDSDLIMQIGCHQDLIFCYPVQYSNVPKILKDFIINHGELWNRKRVFVIATMGLFSGDCRGPAFEDAGQYL